MRVVHSSRDKILLDGDEVEDDSGDEDEVFALKGMPEDSPSEDEYDEDDGMDEDDDIDDVHYAAAAAAAKDKKKAKGKKGKKERKDESSESEEDDESEEEEGWGNKKSAYYASNAEQIESDDEEANELEEQEAKRLQTKARDAMADDDFGLGDVVEGGPEEADGYVIMRSVCFLLNSSDGGSVVAWTSRHRRLCSSCPRTSSRCCGILRRRTQRLWLWPETGRTLRTQ